MRLPANTLAIAGLALLSSALVSCAHRAPALAARPPTVATSLAQTATIKPTEILAGTIAPYQNVAISSALAEPTQVVNVKEGDVVHRGEVLAALNTADLQANLQSLLSTAASNQAKLAQYAYQAPLTITQGGDAVRSTEAALQQAQQTLSNDRLNLERDRQLVANGFIAQQMVDQQTTQVALDQQTIRTAQANVVTARAQVTAYGTMSNGTMSPGLEASIIAQGQADEATSLAAAHQIEAEIARATIVSPVDGVITNRNLNPGEYPGTRQIFTVQQLDPVYAVLNASGSQLVNVRTGTSVTLTSPDDPSLRYKGKVVAVLGQVNPGSTNFIVKAQLSNPGYRLVAGVVVTATVDLRPVHGTGIPLTAFLNDSHVAVMVVQNGTTRTTTVHELGNDGKTAVVAGLPAGTAVVVNGQLGLTDGTQVAVAP